jgi:hypothetical protein
VAPDPKIDFLGRLEHLFKPVDGWGEFRRGARKAAVVFVLYEAEAGGRWEVPFVRRRGDLRDHPGQVALPGGGVHEGESAWEAAQREVEEEIGVPRGRLVPLGAGDPIYAAVSNFSVVPFVAHLPGLSPVSSTSPMSSKECSRYRSKGCSTTAPGSNPPTPGAFDISPMKRASCGASPSASSPAWPPSCGRLWVANPTLAADCEVEPGARALIR